MSTTNLGLALLLQGCTHTRALQRQQCGNLLEPYTRQSTLKHSPFGRAGRAEILTPRRGLPLCTTGRLVYSSPTQSLTKQTRVGHVQTGSMEGEGANDGVGGGNRATLCLTNTKCVHVGNYMTLWCCRWLSQDLAVSLTPPLSCTYECMTCFLSWDLRFTQKHPTKPAWERTLRCSTRKVFGQQLPFNITSRDVTCTGPGLLNITK